MSKVLEQLDPTRKSPVEELLLSLRNALLLLSGVFLLVLLAALVAEFPNMVRYLRVRQM